MKGYNPLGYDTGPLPPNWGSAGNAPRPAPPPAQPTYVQGYWLSPPVAQPAAPAPPQAYWAVPPPPAPPAYATAYAWLSQPAQPAIRSLPAPVNTTTPQPNRIQTSGHRANNTGMPGLNLRNCYGGVGNPPGWNYMFIGTQSPIIFIRSGSCRPWSAAFVGHSANPNNIVSLAPTTIPSNTTVLELLTGAGATNSNPKKNVVVEVTSQGNGKWKRGLTISADDERAKKKISELGWDATRTGVLPGKDFTYLYVSSDTEVGDL